MQTCTECFRKYSEAEIKSWDKDHLPYRKEHPFMCPDCWSALHDGWDIPDDGWDIPDEEDQDDR